MSRRGLAVLALATATLAGGCGGGDKSSASKDPFVAIKRDFEGSPPAQRAAPHWAPLASFSGKGDKAPTVTVAEGSIQWRVRWTCRKGDFRVAVQPPPSGPATSQGKCPGHRTTEFIGRGRRTLQISADGPWQMRVEEEVETPLHEAPLAAMKAKGARVLARGPFRKVERASSGAAQLHRLGNGRLALRFESFKTLANGDLFVWISQKPKIVNTRQALASKHRQIGRLKATLGDQNYVLPKSVKADEIRSIVIWCEPIRIAYATAPLSR